MKKEITILEDDRDIRDICTFIFKNEGYTVNSYGSVSEFSQAPTTTQIFLLDISLPDGNGLDICQKLKMDQRFKEVPIILMSAHMTEATAIASACKADLFIKKPFQLEYLLESVSGLIDKS
ncbi:response regulator transcription factor [Nubsella zeaxanthinifaciens]|jgi:DNA-binding response OmpR family regulator|uniref:response regulator transcription factor n=1 Tax=Nubsella zeaxanthinifaciens TaxID=392412 RepID=UPI003CFED629